MEATISQHNAKQSTMSNRAHRAAKRASSTVDRNPKITRDEDGELICDYNHVGDAAANSAAEDLEKMMENGPTHPLLGSINIEGLTALNAQGLSAVDVPLLTSVAGFTAGKKQAGTAGSDGDESSTIEKERECLAMKKMRSRKANEAATDSEDDTTPATKTQEKNKSQLSKKKGIDADETVGPGIAEPQCQAAHLASGNNKVCFFDTCLGLVNNSGETERPTGNADLEPRTTMKNKKHCLTTAKDLVKEACRCSDVFGMKKPSTENWGKARSK